MPEGSRVLTLDEAQAIATAALRYAGDEALPPVAVAVVDALGSPVVLLRADGALPLTSEIAVGKARTALLLSGPSRVATDFPRALTAPLEQRYCGGFVALPGGLLVGPGSGPAGAVGVSGASSDDDEAAARHGLDAWELARATSP